MNLLDICRNLQENIKLCYKRVASFTFARIKETEGSTKYVYQIFLKYLDMICLAVNSPEVMKKPIYFSFRFDYFAISQYRAFHLQEISVHVVYKWS